jgi:hypothetical protein
VIGVPRTADVALLIGFLQHRRDLGVGIDRLEELVHIDLREPFRESYVFVWRQRLVSEEQHTVCSPCISQLLRSALVELSQINVSDQCTNSFGCDQHVRTLERHHKSASTWAHICCCMQTWLGADQTGDP